LDKALLDTDTFSEILKRVDAQVVRRATEYRSQFGVYTISTITIVEIVKGLHKVQREERLQEFLKGLSAVEVLTLDLSSAELAGRIYADLELTGQPIGRADPMIAAVAIRNGITLITGNSAHYERIKNLNVRPESRWRGRREAAICPLPRVISAWERGG
jgi:tRNA(fMet)-specific endonuclease VapC